MSTRSPWTCILWDVDGTIIDASVGILRRLTITLEHFGKPAPTREELAHWIGPPMYESFQVNVGMTPAEATEAVAFYRTLGKQDGYTTDARLFPGIAEIIHDVHAAGTPGQVMNPTPRPWRHPAGVTSRLAALLVRSGIPDMPRASRLAIRAPRRPRCCARADEAGS